MLGKGRQSCNRKGASRGRGRTEVIRVCLPTGGGDGGSQRGEQSRPEARHSDEGRGGVRAEEEGGSCSASRYIYIYIYSYLYIYIYMFIYIYTILYIYI